jgi:outer membrane protein OmpA-like peptidoglycan-associated protein
LAVFALLATMAGRTWAADADVLYLITNGGEDVGGHGLIEFYKAGHHDGNQVGSTNSGNDIQLPAGRYDVHVTYSDDAVKWDKWFDGQDIAGKVEKTVEAGVAIADVHYLVTNGGDDVGGHATIEFYPAGHHDGKQVDSIGSDGTARMRAGRYDVHVAYGDGAVHWEKWFDGETFAGKVERTVEVNQPHTDVHYVITNNGDDVGGHATIEFYRAGHREGNQVSSGASGDTERMPQGRYDVHVSFGDGAVRWDKWYDNQDFSGSVERTVELGLSIADVRYVVTNNGDDVGGHAVIEFYPTGRHDGNQVSSGSSGDSVRMPQGRYDVHIAFGDGSARWEKWFDGQDFAGKVEKTVEIAQTITEVRYLVTNHGDDVGGHAVIEFYPAGRHDGNQVGSGSSGDSVRMPQGRYDVHIAFGDGSAHWEKWFDGQDFAGNVEKTVEIAQAITEVRYLVTNHGDDVGGHAVIEFYPAGRHDGNQVGSGSSGDSVRMPQGRYDVHIAFGDGTVHWEKWFDGQDFAGKVDRTLELGLPIATVTYVVTNGGNDLKGRGLLDYFPAGHRDGDNIASAASGDSVRMLDGTYDVRVSFSTGFVRKVIWIGAQAFTGTVSRTVELGVQVAQPTVTVTQNNASTGDKAVVAYVDPKTHDEIGSLPGGQTAEVEAGTYDIHASLFGAEGWLRGSAIAGKQQLTIDIKPLKTEQLRPNGPPPTACVIEVYGVNFDFDKAVLRPDSTPVLNRILDLFTHNPGFNAEVGGHTDNVGTEQYNMKLSDARAASVRTWLIGKGVAATRVSSRGYGDTRPLVPNTTDENRFKNRRVELRTEACR